jgi:hypothetical protein
METFFNVVLILAGVTLLILVINLGGLLVLFFTDTTLKIADRIRSRQLKKRLDRYHQGFPLTRRKYRRKKYSTPVE